MRIENYEFIEDKELPYVYYFAFDPEHYELALNRGRIVN